VAEQASTAGAGDSHRPVGPRPQTEGASDAAQEAALPAEDEPGERDDPAGADGP
jgi:hypothetical protein